MSLQEKRKEKGLSQSQLAKKADVKLRTLQYYEQGSKDINGAKLNTLLDLAMALECPISEIVTDLELIKKINLYGIQ